MPQSRAEAGPYTPHTLRRRRTHAKSRRGCRNCKIRRVKCDEKQPQCRKCVLYGVMCSYNANGPDLQPLQPHPLRKIAPDTSFGPVGSNQIPVPRTLHIDVNIGAGSGPFKLDAESIARFGRFQHRTVLTFGAEQSFEIYRAHIPRLAMEHPFLMHIIQAITATHDRYLAMVSGSTKRSLIEAYHGARAAELLNEKLSAGIKPQDRDPLWASAAMLGIASFTSIEASSPLEAWPLKPSEPSDLNWLDMAQGKKAIWNITNPLRPDSIFHETADAFRSLLAKPPPCTLEDIPPPLIELFDLNDQTRQGSPNQNPYFSALSILIHLRHVSCTRASLTRHLAFLSFIEPEFRRLLQMKDPRALLLFAYWYAPMCDSFWWIMRRARLECQAICLYLEKYHADQEDICSMLEYPRRQCGL